MVLFDATESFILYVDSQARVLSVSTIEGKRYVRLLDLLSAAGTVNVVERSESLLQIRLGRNNLIFRPNSTLAVVNGTLVSLNDPSLVLSGAWMIPLDSIAKLFPRLTDRKVVFHSGALRAFVSSQIPSKVYFEASKGILTSRLAIEVGQPVPFEPRRDGQQIVISLGVQPLDPANERLNYSDDLIQSIAFDDADFKPKIRIALTPGPTDVKTSVSQDGHLFVMTLSRIQTAPPAPKKAPPQKPSAATPSTTPAPPLPLGQSRQLHIVTIDPGHGGVDTGARSMGNEVFAKDLNLLIAQRIRFILQRRFGLQVYLTREGDSDVSLDQRAMIANMNRSDVFISIHVGFSLAQNYSGARVYIFSPLEPPPAPSAPAEVGDGTNETSTPSAQAPPLEHTYFRDWARANADNFKMNDILAETIQSQLAILWNREPQPPRTAPLRPLANVVMPAVMVEIGNLNSEEDVKRLRDVQFQTSIASAIANAIQQFKPIYEGQLRDAKTP
ncbi:MAG: N-acetylmuramoyl-L-alanine amidase [Acidobacteriia bacterium]|nr:N-acetylmuramoyl-L-alanine amidase [Terriglobia bacterium]